MRDCPTSGRRVLDPANRGSSGSRAIDHLSRGKAQPRSPHRLQTKLRPGTDAGTALGGLAPRTRARAAPRRSRASRQRLVARAGRWPARSPKRPQRHQLREHLPLHLRPDRPYQRLPLAALFAARQEQARFSRPQGRQLRNPHRRPYFRGRTTGRSRRPQQPRSLGGRPHAVRQVRPSRAHRS